MKLPELKQFALVGGTNLALRLGHRFSVDLDIFTNEPFDLQEVWDAVLREFPQVLKLDERGQTLLANIDGVKIELIKHAYPYLFSVEEIEGIRMISIPDIIPMKLGAMARRGSKKDFWDIAYLLDHFSLSEMLDFFKESLNVCRSIFFSCD
ncbi:MAG: nucleotidyl transferase AbiEii/AbiGii toxin family protein [Saprospiraceae bacterium]|nr:nucleotidyl transferase AbiEii/AbiGii toxin family protein [Saprospiraceae bacterium]